LLPPDKETLMNTAKVMQVTRLAIVLTVAMMVTVTLAQAEVKRYDVPDRDSPTIGPDKAAVTIIEFIDYQ